MSEHERYRGLIDSGLEILMSDHPYFDRIRPHLNKVHRLRFGSRKFEEQATAHLLALSKDDPQLLQQIAYNQYKDKAD